jgi:hypothetical protein
VLPNSDLRLFSGLHFATARTSNPSTPKPSCPKGLYVTWAPGNTGLWICCKNSDKKGDCKVGQAAFPYGPRSKLVCCQCPTGQALNKDKTGCMPTGAPSPSSTESPTLSPIAVTTPSPTYEQTPSPSAVPEPEPTPSGPTPPPTSDGTPLPSDEPTPYPSYPQVPYTYRPTFNPNSPYPHCVDGYEGIYGKLLYQGENVLRGKWNFSMCCKAGDACLPGEQALTEGPKSSPTSRALCCACVAPSYWLQSTNPWCFP